MQPNPNSARYGSGHIDKSLSLAFLFDHFDLSFLWPIIRRKFSLHGRPRDYKAMFRALLLKEMGQIASRRKLVRFLEKDKFWLNKCGFAEPPAHVAFCRFAKRIGPDAFEQVFNELVNEVGRIKEIGKIVAVDSTSITAYSRYRKNKKNSDPDAAWGVTIKNGKQDWVFGYKVHIVADAELEIPLGFEVTPANIYDSTRYQPLLTDLMERGIKPKIILADKGYDTKSNYFFTLEHEAIPIIAMNPRNLKEGRKRDFEVDFPIQRNSRKWKKLYKKRGAVEKVNSRLKEELNLKALKVRELERVRIHTAVSLIAMLTVALIAFKSGNGNHSTSVNSFKF